MWSGWNEVESGGRGSLYNLPRRLVHATARDRSPSIRSGTGAFTRSASGPENRGLSPISARYFRSAVHRHILRLFKGAGVSPGRIDLQGPTLNLIDHLSLYGRVDVALDPFPYNGATTTCEALWMGVPVITLAGNAHRGRVGASLLNAVGLGRFVAETPEQYLTLAAGLAADPDHLAELRTTLRRQVNESSLCDAPAFARKVEAAYRNMWHAWCAKASGS